MQAPRVAQHGKRGRGCASAASSDCWAQAFLESVGRSWTGVVEDRFKRTITTKLRRRGILLRSDTCLVTGRPFLFWMVPRTRRRRRSKSRNNAQGVSWAAQRAVVTSSAAPTSPICCDVRGMIERSCRRARPAIEPVGVTVSSVEIRDVVIITTAAGRDVRAKQQRHGEGGAHHPRGEAELAIAHSFARAAQA